MSIQNAILIEGRSQGVSTAGETLPLEAGVYDVWAAADAFIAVVPRDTLASYVTANNGYRVPGGAGNIPVRIGRDGLKIVTTAQISYHRTE